MALSGSVFKASNTMTLFLSSWVRVSMTAGIIFLKHNGLILLIEQLSELEMEILSQNVALFVLIYCIIYKDEWPKVSHPKTPKHPIFLLT